MSAAIRITRVELERRLALYKCRKIADVAPDIELWETGWHEPFTLFPHDGFYDDFQYRRVILLVGRTMPPGWNGNGGK
jgi:hypothetical protein